MKADDMSIVSELFESCPDLDIEPQTLDEMFRDALNIINLDNIELTTNKENYGYCFWVIDATNHGFRAYLFDDLVYDLFFYFLMNDN